MTDNRLNGADFVRATACLTVLFHHLAQRMSWEDQLGAVYWDPLIDHGKASDPTRFVVTCAIITVITFTVAHLSYHLVEKTR